MIEKQRHCGGKSLFKIDGEYVVKEHIVHKY